MLYCDEKRSIEIAKYIVETGATVRKAAKYYGISKSTVHKDVTNKLKYIDVSLYDDVRKVLSKNKSERHIRGGEATKLKYLSIGK